MSEKGIESSGIKSVPVVVQSESVFNTGIIFNESNYDVWSQLMVIHIAEREKLSYILGKIKQLAKSEDGYEKWELVEIFRELDHRDKVVMKDLDDVAAYQKSIEQLRAHIFLAGLDGDFEQVHGKILRKEPISGLEECYALIQREVVCRATLKDETRNSEFAAMGEYQKGIQTLDYDILTLDYDQSDAKIDTEKGDVNGMILDLDSHLEAEEVPKSQDVSSSLEEFKSLINKPHQSSTKNVPILEPELPRKQLLERLTRVINFSWPSKSCNLIIELDDQKETQPPKTTCCICRIGGVWNKRVMSLRLKEIGLCNLKRLEEVLLEKGRVYKEEQIMVVKVVKRRH
ncbi:hypothetical protein ACH5RR_025625 [Cinchona calisaya]|uniref:Uncharacterized protein n=1 Tax=Cinchona calisaya TaxID=153742 RepID=A0ABD2Z061_9GENT